jgi:hypothetical protein
MAVQPFASFAQPHCRVNLKKILTDLSFAGDAIAERTLFKTFECAPQFIDSWIALERQKCIYFMECQLTVHKRLARAIQSVRILQVIVQPDQDGTPQYPFALHHRHLRLFDRVRKSLIPYMSLPPISPAILPTG